MISEADQEYIIDRLTAWVAPLEKPREALTAAFIGTAFPEQLGQGLPAQLVREAVRIARVDEWNHQPPWLDLLLHLLPQDEKISIIREELRHRPLDTLDPIKTTILSSGVPFVGRGRPRDDLLYLVSDP